MTHQPLTLFSQFIIQHAQQHKTGLIPVLSRKFISQKDTYHFILNDLTERYAGFVVYKNNKYPYDDFTDLKHFLKPDTIIIINEITNSYQYNEVLDLAKKHLVIAGFECFCSSKNYLEDFVHRFSRISDISITDIEPSIMCAFLCDYTEDTHSIEYTLL